MDNKYSTQAHATSKSNLNLDLAKVVSKKSIHGPGLYLVPTPIGNLEDITLRALNVLNESFAILCEDRRVTGRLLNHYGIQSKLILYNDAATIKVRQRILDLLKDQKMLSLVSDAGMPCVSDPGYRLVNECLTHNIHVTALPGPVAFVTAAVCSGLPTDRLSFHGFMPRKESERTDYLKNLAANITHAFYESPMRLIKTLTALTKTCPHAKLTIVRELSKRYETIYRGTPKDLCVHFNSTPPKGEFVLLVHNQNGHPSPEIFLETQRQYILDRLTRGDGVKLLAENMAKQSQTLSKNDAYKWIQKLKDQILS